jgi:hypothetical protein
MDSLFLEEAGGLQCHSFPLIKTMLPNAQGTDVCVGFTVSLQIMMPLPDAASFFTRDSIDV